MNCKLKSISSNSDLLSSLSSSPVTDQVPAKLSEPFVTVKRLLVSNSKIYPLNDAVLSRLSGVIGDPPLLAIDRAVLNFRDLRSGLILIVIILVIT